jgi:bacterial/archaeal transporter family protein
MWLVLALISAVTLGIYDVFKKISVKNNAVLPVLLVSCATSALIFVFIKAASVVSPETMVRLGIFVPAITPHEHVLIFIKSVLVVTSWVFSFFALKHLPLTIVAPIRSTAPVWTLIGALVIFSERLSPVQWIGISITIIFFYLFSVAGKSEGIEFKNNKWILFIVIATLLGSASGLYDKHLMRHYDRIAVQAWFSFYQVALLLPFTMLTWYPIRKNNPFTWRWSIPLIGLFLLIADFVYFYALSYPESLISIVSAIRRSGVVIAFAFGALLFKEKNIKQKALYLAGIIIGVTLMMLS